MGRPRLLGLFVGTVSSANPEKLLRFEVEWDSQCNNREKTKGVVVFKSRVIAGLVALGLSSSVLVASSVSAHAQLRTGDIITFGWIGSLQSNWRGLGFITTRGTVGTLSQGIGNRFEIGTDNRSVVALSWGGGNPALVSFDLASRSVTTVAPLPGWPQDFALDQDGSAITAINNVIYRVNGSSISTLAKVFSSNYFPIKRVVRDEDTGEFILVPSPGGGPSGFYRMDPTSGRIRFVSMSGRSIDPFAAAFSQRFGDLVVGTGGGFLVYVSPQTAKERLTLRPPFTQYDLTIDQATAHLLVIGNDRLIRYTAEGIAFQTFGPYFKTVFETARFVSSRPLNGHGTGQRGTTYPMTIDLPEAPGAAYCLAASFAGFRPGFATNRWLINIAPDPLFFATACNAFPGTTGFVGRLDATGHAKATMAIPPSIPVGTRYTVAAVILDSNRPGRLASAGAISVFAR